MAERVYIETVGCQMNVLDSELVISGLVQAGYEVVDSPRDADTILFNTCSVRQHAEDKVYSALGRLRPLKERRPETIIAVFGCMAEKDQDQIFRRAAHVDLVVGPGQLNHLPEILEEIAAQRYREPRLEVSLDRMHQRRSLVEASFARFDPPRPPELRASPFQAMVRIMFGCDKFCTYCIVPKVRGPEQSRPAAEVVSEVRRLAGDGCLEITLLGQTVNSYQDEHEGRTLRLSDLLAHFNEIDGLQRIKFVTNFPRHMSDDLLQAVRDLPKVSPYFHVPAQSGSNEQLRRMKRGYTAEDYREMVERFRAIVPGAAITSDFIVGFCGETEEDFRQTVELVRWARFKNSFIFKYSERPGTKAAGVMPDDVPDEIKRRRNELLAVQNAISLEENLPLVGQDVEVLVEGPSKSAQKRAAGHHVPMVAVVAADEVVQLAGRSVGDHIVVFDGPRTLVGQILPVRIEKADAFTLCGRV